jgi:hypothetical protein
VLRALGLNQAATEFDSATQKAITRNDSQWDTKSEDSANPSSARNEKDGEEEPQHLNKQEESKPWFNV